MARRSAPILLALGIVLAIATGGLVFYLLQHAVPAGATAQPPAPTPVPTKPVLVAANPLAVGATITDTDITTREYPEELVPVGVITDSTTLTGRVVLEPIQAGEFFRPDQIGDADHGPLSAQLEPGKVAMAFSRDDLLNQSNVLQEGDHVDLLLTINIKEESATETREGKATTYTLQNIKVLRIAGQQPTQDNPTPEAHQVVFEFDPQDAVIAKFVKDSEGTVDFTLRARSDDQPYETRMINQDYFFDTYGIRAPISSTKPK